MTAYEQFYKLDEYLASDPLLVQSPELYAFVDELIYAAQMDRLAQPLPNGDESPFSSKDPGSAHALLTAAIIHLQHLQAHEFNLVTDATWVAFLKMLGTQMRPAERPVINLVFYRSQQAIAAGIPAEIPFDTEVRSRIDPGLAVYTLYTVQITGSADRVTVPASLNRLGALPNIRLKEFTDIPRLLSNIEGCENDGVVVVPGRSAETLTEAVLRAREGIRSATLGQDSFLSGSPRGYCLTLADHAYWAKRLGAQQVNVVKGTQHGAGGTYLDLNLVAVYPPDVRDTILNGMLPMTIAEQRLDVKSAEVIPIDGRVGVRVDPTIPNYQVFDLVAQAIATTVNPPYGNWGDTNFAVTLATALEAVQGILATPTVELKHAETNQPLSELDLQPWSLLEIQQTLDIEVLR